VLEHVVPVARRASRGAGHGGQVDEQRRDEDGWVGVGESGEEKTKGGGVYCCGGGLRVKVCVVAVDGAGG